MIHGIRQLKISVVWGRVYMILWEMYQYVSI